MPATHLIRVDLPAPLSPTSAITSPGRTSKSTSLSAWTEPKLFEIPWSSRSGVVVASAVVVMGAKSGGAPSGRAPTLVPSYVQYFLYSPTQTFDFFK